MAAFADEPGAFQRIVAVPAVGGQRPRVDQVAHDRAGAMRPELGSHLREHGREPPVEAHHQPVVAGSRDSLDHPVELVTGQRQGLLHEDCLPCLQGPADHGRVGVVAGHDEDGVKRLVVEHRVGVGGRRGEPEPPLRVDRGQGPGGRDVGK